MSRLAGLSGPDDRGYRPSGRPAVPGAATAGTGPAPLPRNGRSRSMGSGKTMVEFWLVPSLARPSDDSSDPVQRYSDEIAYHLMTDAGFRLSLTHRALHGRTLFIPRAASPQLIAHLTER